ncbi:Alpha-1,2-mannosyltransferase MNN22 [Candida viswanathii]|uniref:Alpha-1,2-mannosyltransferase MNN22 n=1 Tax=Candida viswanathii TaxID=5486 RepID=A0A367XQV9_9ASCO|nr:Alpha-1,2-mannosyltransferase MNN22 [Candida viswanathii]
MSFRREIKWFMKPSRMAILLALAFSLIISLLSFQHHQATGIINKANDYINGFTDKFASQEEIIDESELDLHVVNDFWTGVFNVFEDNKFPSDLEPLIKYVPKDEQLKGKVNSREVLNSKAEIFNKANITEFHRAVFEGLPDELPTTVYRQGTRGVVTVGGDFYSWLAYINILHLRRIGSDLPVEVIMPAIGDYTREQEFCEVLLPKVNARCVVVPEVMGVKAFKKWLFKSYQFKILAIALSSFQHVLLVDSENMAARDPRLLFDLPVYQDKGMVLWPDYWQRTIHPEWYEIAGKKYSTIYKTKDGKFPLNGPVPLTPEEEANTRFNDLAGTIPDMSTESGQLMINKGTHGKVVLMSIYYNLFGPELYYKLFSLGELGEGDKDTFIAAAYVCDKPWYQVHSTIRTFGYHSEGAFHGMVMGQKNPQQDYEKFLQNVQDGAKTPEDITNWNNMFNGGDVEVFFMHCNIRKINPVNFMNDGGLSDKEKNRMKVRFYSSFKYHDNFGNEIDFELSRWEIVFKILCVDDTRFRFIKDANFNQVCSFVNNTIEWMKTN